MERRGFTERKLKEISENLDIRKRGDDRDVAGLNQRRRGEFVALQWYRLDRNVPHVLSNLFAGQQKPNRFRRDDAGKPALVLYWSMGGKLCNGHCESRLFLHERSRLHQMGFAAVIGGRVRSFIHLGFCGPSLMKIHQAVDLPRPSGVKSSGHDKGTRQETRTGHWCSTAFPRPSNRLDGGSRQPLKPSGMLSN